MKSILIAMMRIWQRLSLEIEHSTQKNESPLPYDPPMPNEPGLTAYECPNSGYLANVLDKPKVAH